MNIQKIPLAYKDSEYRKDFSTVNLTAQAGCPKCVRQRAAVEKLAQLVAEIKKLLHEFKTRQLLIEEQVANWQR